MLRLKVNGAARQFDGDPVMPLLWFLRDELNLKGTKFGCGIGMCGACTLHLIAKTAKPTDEDIENAMNNNLCRCGTYLRVRAAIHKTAEMTVSKNTSKPVTKTPRATASALPVKGGKK